MTEKLGMYISCIICIIAGFVLGMLVFRVPSDAVQYNIEMKRAYDNYYNNVETLLDYIHSIDFDFDDVIMESDQYFEYEKSRDKVNYLKNTHNLDKYKQYCDSINKV